MAPLCSSQQLSSSSLIAKGHTVTGQVKPIGQRGHPALLTGAIIHDGSTLLLVLTGNNISRYKEPNEKLKSANAPVFTSTHHQADASYVIPAHISSVIPRTHLLRHPRTHLLRHPPHAPPPSSPHAPPTSSPARTSSVIPRTHLLRHPSTTSSVTPTAPLPSSRTQLLRHPRTHTLRHPRMPLSGDLPKRLSKLIQSYKKIPALESEGGCIK